MKKLIEKVEQIISPVYLVGGAVRDTLLNKKPKDYDFATSLSSEAMEVLIREAGRKPYLVGARFGTVGFKIEDDKEFKYIEITTFRNDKYRKGNRKPEVNFVKNITADLSRRDFTINAIAFRNNKYIDPFNGREDLKNGIIKAVGKATQRLKEDPLRMLRAGRLASKLNFKIDDELKDAVKKVNHKILEVSKERWMIEFDKLLMTDKPSIALDFFMETRLMNFMIPELALQYKYNQNSKYHDLELWEHTKTALDFTPKDINIRWAILLHDIGKPFVRTDRVLSDTEIKTNYIKHDLVGYEFVLKIAKYLKWSNLRTEIVSKLVLNHLAEDSPLKEYDNKGKKNNE